MDSGHGNLARRWTSAWITTLGIASLVAPTTAWTKPPALHPSPAAADADDDASEVAGTSLPHSRDKASDLRAIFKAVPGKIRAGGLVVDLATGATLFEDNADGVLTPASVAKLFATAAAVRTLDLDKKPTTVVRAVGKGSEPAALVLVGAADPTMTLSEWTKLAQAVKKAGIVRTKKLIIDTSLMDDQLPKGFDQKPTDAAFRAPIGALMVDASTLQVTLRPGKVGAPPLVEVTPDAGDAVVVLNLAKTVAGKRDAPVVLTRPNGRKTEVVIQGTIAVSRKIVGSGRRRVADASYFAGHVFKRLLQAQGIEVTSGPEFVTAGKDVGGEPIASHLHHDWRAVLHVTNKQSHNQFAETLFKLVGVHQLGAPGTNQKAFDGVRKALAPLQLQWQGTQIYNGSGLYRADTVTCRTTVALLRAMTKDPKFADFKASLAIGGVDGTVRGRLKGPETLGKVFAKTGTLDDVSGLAGYAEGNGTTYAFALFFNDIKGPAPYRSVQDRLLRRLLQP